MSTLRSASPAAELPTLLARYVNGKITDPSWEQLMSVFDAGDVTHPERLAMARFFNEVMDEMGPEALWTPKPDELQALLTETRHA